MNTLLLMAALAVPAQAGAQFERLEALAAMGPEAAGRSVEGAPARPALAVAGGKTAAAAAAPEAAPGKPAPGPVVPEPEADAGPSVDWEGVEFVAQVGLMGLLYGSLIGAVIGLSTGGVGLPFAVLAGAAAGLVAGLWVGLVGYLKG